MVVAEAVGHGLETLHPHSVRRGGQMYYYHMEEPGNVAGLTDAARNVVLAYEYGPFGTSGVLVLGEAEVPNPLRFGAREWDAETGLYYNRARYYDPALGRFVSEDPIGLAGGVNPYVYVGNSPADATDPYGLCPNGYELKPFYFEDGRVEYHCSPRGSAHGTPVVVSAPWPFSTPRSQGWGGNPGLRGGSWYSPADGSGGFCGYACGKGAVSVPAASYEPMSEFAQCMASDPVLPVATGVFAIATGVQIKAPGQWRPGGSIFGNVDRRFPNLPGADPQGGIQVRTAGRTVERPKSTGRYGLASLLAASFSGGYIAATAHRCSS